MTYGEQVYREDLLQEIACVESTKKALRTQEENYRQIAKAMDTDAAREMYEGLADALSDLVGDDVFSALQDLNEQLEESGYREDNPAAMGAHEYGLTI